jgi:hypothetical protein
MSVKQIADRALAQLLYKTEGLSELLLSGAEHGFR